ncbi:sodium/glucose cotransporter 1-like isoform X2 [Artemia franciscana]
MHWILVGASLFASNIGSGHFVGVAGSAAAAGIGIGAYELSAIYIAIILGWLFVPVYMASGIVTMPEYIRKRFGGQRIRIYLSVLSLLLYVFTKISADLYAGALFIQLAIGNTSEESLYLSIIFLLAIAALFTIAGGLSAVIWTDFVQTILMLIGAFILMGISFAEVGGYNKMIEGFFNAFPQNISNLECARIPDYSMHLLRDPLPGKSDLPWTGVVFGLTISSIWYWCSDQVIVQRCLASKNMTHAKGGCILAGYLKVLPLFLMVFPGMISRILNADTVACNDPDECYRICQSRYGCTNTAYPELVIKYMPVGLRGMMLAVMLAALMSSLTSVFNSSSTIFTIDIWTRIRKAASDIELLIVGRVFTLVLVTVSILWIPIIQSSKESQLFNYIQSVTSYLAPPVCAIYILAVFTNRINEKGAFWSLMIGLATGIIRFGLEFGYVIPPCGSVEPDTRPEVIMRIVGDIHFLHFGCILFLITGFFAVIISALTEPLDPAYLHRLTWWTRYSRKVRLDLRDEIEEQAELAKRRELKRQNESETNLVEKKLPTWRRALNFVCGVETQKVTTVIENDRVKLSPQEEAKEAADFLKEDHFWGRFVNINAIIIMGCASFLWGFYA